MHSFKNYALAATGVIALALSITLVTTKRAGAQQTEAIGRAPVVTPAAKPVSPVEITNTPLPVLDIDNARQPYQSGNWLVQASNGQLFANTSILTVPSGKRLVIEHVTAEGSSPNGRIISASVRTTVSVWVEDHQLVLTDQGVSANNGNFYQATSQPMKFYADPGTSVVVSFERNDNRNKTSMTFQLSGYYIDLPQPQDMGR